MNQLQVVSVNGQLVTDSRDVAEMVNREHNGLMKSIRGYMQHLTKGEITLSDFFIESSYQDSTGRTLPCFLLTKKGCDMVANKMTGEKGVLFSAEYVTRFEEMEQALQKPKVLSDKEQLLASMKLSIEANETLEQHDDRIKSLEETMRIDGAQEFKIRTNANRKVMKVLGGKKSPAYKELSRKAFSNFWRDFKNHFTIPRYGDLPKKQFDQGLRFIELWQPETSLLIDIDNANMQQVIREVI